MLQTKFITDILGIEENIVKNHKRIDDRLELQIELPIRAHNCPSCSYLTSVVHDYRTRTIKDIPFRGSIKTIIHYRQRRYVCPVCKKRLKEHQSFVPAYSRHTSQMNMYLYQQFNKEWSLKSIAQHSGVSANKVHRLLKEFTIPAPSTLPRVISIDEFKGNAGRKFQFVINDPVNKKILDILPGRESHILSSYFRQFSKDIREKVLFVVMDMSKAFKSEVSTFFPNVTIIIDKFHVVRYCTWSLEAIRKNGQKRLSADLRKFFKHSRKLLNKRASALKDEQKEQTALMLQILPELQSGYFLKEKFFSFIDSDNSSDARVRLKEFLFHAEVLNLPEYKAMVTMLKNWGKYILNMFDHHLSNGFTEGKNNKIKVLKRNAYGFRNFENLRKRILLMS